MVGGYYDQIWAGSHQSVIHKQKDLGMRKPPKEVDMFSLFCVLFVLWMIYSSSLPFSEAYLLPIQYMHVYVNYKTSILRVTGKAHKNHTCPTPEKSPKKYEKILKPWT